MTTIDKKNIGDKTINVLLFGSLGKHTKNITRPVYKEKNGVVFWVEIYEGSWRNTDKSGIKNGFVLVEDEFNNIPEKDIVISDKEMQQMIYKFVMSI